MDKDILLRSNNFKNDSKLYIWINVEKADCLFKF